MENLNPSFSDSSINRRLRTLLFIIFGFVFIISSIIIDVFIPFDQSSIPYWIRIGAKVGSGTFIVIGVSICYSYLVKKFVEGKLELDSPFQKRLIGMVTGMNTIFSQCYKEGILQLDTRKKLNQKIDFELILDNAKEGSEIFIFGRTNEFIFKKYRKLQKAIEKKKINFKMAILEQKPDPRSPAIKLSKTHLESQLSPVYNNDICHIINWYEDYCKIHDSGGKKLGSLEIKAHNIHLPNSCCCYEDQNNRKVINWDISFGNDMDEKWVIILEVKPKQLGYYLLERFKDVYTNENACKLILQLKDGKAHKDPLWSQCNGL